MFIGLVVYHIWIYVKDKVFSLVQIVLFSVYLYRTDGQTDTQTTVNYSYCWGQKLLTKYQTSLVMVYTKYEWGQIPQKEHFSSFDIFTSESVLRRRGYRHYFNVLLLVSILYNHYMISGVGSDHSETTFSKQKFTS